MKSIFLPYTALKFNGTVYLSCCHDIQADPLWAGSSNTEAVPPPSLVDKAFPGRAICMSGNDQNSNFNSTNSEVPSAKLH